MSKTAKVWVGVVIVVVIVLIAVFNGRTGQTQKITIGAVLPLTGPGASIGELLKDGLNWKVAQLEESGVDIDLKIEDTQSDPKIAVSAFNKMTDVDGLKIIFTITSSSGMNLKPIAESKKILLWGDISHSEFTKDSHYLLRHSNITDMQATVMSDHILSNGFKKVGIVYQQDDFGISYNSNLTKDLQDKGISTNSESIDAKSGDFRSSLAKIKSTNPDAIVIAVAGPAAGILVKQAKELGFSGTMYESVGFILTPAAQEIAGDLAKGIYYEAYADNPGFVSEYNKKFGKNPPALAQIGYTDIELLFDAIKTTGSTDPEKLIANIKSRRLFTGNFETVEISPNGDIVVPTIIKKW